MSLPKMTHHQNFKVLSSKFKVRLGFSLIELLVARHPKPWRRKATLGFSLIELLVVITIIGILASLGAASYTKAQQKGRDGKRKADLKAVQQALELYFQSYSRYPAQDAGGFIQCHTTSTSVAWGASFTCDSKTFMSRLPKDPTGTPEYFFSTASTITYTLLAKMENADDPDYCSSPLQCTFKHGCTVTAAQITTGYRYCQKQP